MAQAWIKKDFKSDTKSFANGANVAYGSSNSWTPDNFAPWDKIDLLVTGQITTNAQTIHPDGLARLIAGVSVRGGGNTYVNDLSGVQLQVMSQAKTGKREADFNGGGNGNSNPTTGNFRLTIPVVFSQPRWGAIGMLTALPATLFTDLTITVRVGQLADVDIGGSPALVIANLQITPVIHTFEPYSIPAGFAFARVEQSTKIYTAAQIQTQKTDFQLLVGGKYSYIINRAYSAANTPGSDGGTPFPVLPTNVYQLFDPVRNIKFDTTWHKLRAEYHKQVMDTPFVGTAPFMFGSSPATLFDSDLANKASQYVTITADTVAATGNAIEFINERIFDGGLLAPYGA